MTSQSSSAPASSTTLESPVKQLLPLITAGLVTGIIAVTIAAAFGTLLFSCGGDGCVALGITLMLLSTMVISLLLSFTSSFRGMIGGLQDSVLPILSLAVVAVIDQMPALASDGELLINLMATLGLASLLTGGVLLLLGQLKLGSLIRYIPYPVTGGFLAGTGLLLAEGAIKIETGEGILPSISQPDLLVKWLPILVFAILLLIAVRKIDHILTVPGMILAASLIFALIPALTGASGATPQSILPRSALPSIDPALLQAINWKIIIGQSGNLVVVALISLLSISLNVSGLELATQQDIDLNHELKASGYTNLAVGLIGGMVGSPILSDTTLVRRLGVRSRWVGVIVALVCVLGLFMGRTLLVVIPQQVLSGLLLFLGLDFLLTWLYETWFKLPKTDYLIIVTIMLVITLVGMLQGVALGLLLSAFLFMVNFSRIGVIKDRLSGITHRSNVERPRLYRQLLEKKGHWLLILRLQGYIFFGTANALMEQFHRHITQEDTRGPRYVVLDFRLVTGLDTSAVFSFTKMRQVAAKNNIKLVFTNLSEQICQQMENVMVEGQTFIFDDLDHGTEWCEDQMIDVFNSTGLAARPANLDELLAAGLRSRDDAEVLLRYFEETTVQPGDPLIRQGDQPLGIYFVKSGQVSVILCCEDGAEIRLRSLGVGTVIGEMGIYLSAPASASVVADEETQFYVLSTDCLHRLGTEEPGIAAAFHRFMAQYLAEKLVGSDKAIQAILS